MKKLWVIVVVIWLLNDNNQLYSQSNNTSIQFDGVDDFVNMGDPVNGSLDFTTNAPFTMMAWIKTTFTPATYADIISKRYVVSGTHYEGYMMALNSSGRIYFVIEDVGGAFTQMNGNIIVNDGNWHLITATRDIINDKVNVYVDGFLDISLADNTNSTLESAVDFWIGQWPFYGRYFDGKIDEVSIWSIAMDTSQINNYMECPPVGNESNLISYWDFEEGTSVTVNDASSNLNNGTITNGAIWVADNPNYACMGVQGNIYQDLNQDCVYNSSEVGLAGRMAVINPGNIIVETSANGLWFLDSLPAGTYTISIDTSGNWLSTCSATQTFTVTNPYIMTYAPNFGLLSTFPCPNSYVSVNMPFIRRCFADQKVYVQACNEIIATDILNNGYVDLALDTFLTVTSASTAYTDLGNNVFRFLLQNTTLYPGQCESFWVATTVSCETILGQTLCNEANLYPADSCIFDTIPADVPGDFTPCSLPWDQSSISVDGWCDDGNTYFTITNTGDPGDGDMECYSPVRLYIDGQYIWLDSIMITGGVTDTLVFAGDGRTWRLEVDQHPLHPGNSHPNAVIELCGDTTNWTPNLVTTLPLDDADPVVDIYCGPVTGSYDPNDKTGYPLGVTSDHFITPNGSLEYLIRFQNTGTDTAFTVVVRDTLDLDLNIFSVLSGASSHSYTFQKYGPRVLEWTFNPILLPDSTTDESGSHGFVTFTVDQMPDLPDGTEINNEVGIYFDFNAPVITNTTSHIIQRNISQPSYLNTANISDTACFEYTMNDFTYTNSGNYYQIDGSTLYNLELLIAHPYISGFATEDTVCLTESTALYATGGLTYTWSDGIINNQPFTPEVSQMYYVSATDEFGCVSLDSVYVMVNDSLVSSDFSILLENYSITLQNTSSPFDHDVFWEVNDSLISTEEVFSYTFPSNGIYEICLTASNSCNSDTECLTVTVDGLGIHILSEPDFSIYPNPADNVLFINFPNEFLDKNYLIYDASGKVVLNGFLNQNSISIESLATGIYLLEVKSNENEKRIKFIKK